MTAHISKSKIQVLNYVPTFCFVESYVCLLQGFVKRGIFGILRLHGHFDRIHEDTISSLVTMHGQSTRTTWPAQLLLTDLEWYFQSTIRDSVLKSMFFIYSTHHSPTPIVKFLNFRSRCSAPCNSIGKINVLYIDPFSDTWDDIYKLFQRDPTHYQL